ncbi:MAG: DUF4215 domain-containing protein [Myxococcota bacterium]|nr:DUF4215 domain-containing protein [Myxococcota bacterium]
MFNLKIISAAIAALALVATAGCVTDDDSTSQQLAGVQEHAGDDCTLTQGYWKNHEEAWPVASLALGGVSYTKAQLLSILRTPVKGNGLISLSHQLIAAKLNLANGASSSSIDDAIDDADDLIGNLVVPPVGTGHLSPSATSGVAGALDGFNNGGTGPGHCDDAPNPPPPPPSGPVCGNGTVEAGEECDDGNTTNGDSCSSTCICTCPTEPPPPPAPVCGNGVVEAGEQCDDGNATSGDGCSATCVSEPPPPPAPVCGDGVLDAAEHCDDGNLVNGDGCSAICECEPVTRTDATASVPVLMAERP